MIVYRCITCISCDGRSWHWFPSLASFLPRILFAAIREFQIIIIISHFPHFWISKIIQEVFYNSITQLTRLMRPFYPILMTIRSKTVATDVTSGTVGYHLQQITFTCQQKARFHFWNNFSCLNKRKYFINDSWSLFALFQKAATSISTAFS